MQAQPGGRDEQRGGHRELAATGDLYGRDRERETCRKLNRKCSDARTARCELGMFARLVHAHHDKRRCRGGEDGES